MNGTVYLIHLDERIGDPDNPRAQAQHYIGWALDADARLEEHRAGRGAAMLAYASMVGIGMRIVKRWEDADRNEERRLKNMKCAPRLCPECNPPKERKTHAHSRRRPRGRHGASV